MAKTNIGRVVPIHKGTYSAEATYRLNHLVNYNGSLYWHFGKEDTTGVPPTNASVWVVVTDLSEAEGFIRRAETAAENAESAANRAETSEDNAQLYKQSAEQASEDAQTAKDTSVAAANQSSTAVTQAQSAAQSAALSAGNAAGFAQSAEAAQSGAEQAKADAVKAQKAAAQSETNIQGVESSVNTAKDEAVKAKQSAEAAQSGAEQAKADAESAKEFAAASAGAANTAKVAAESAKVDAVSSKTAAAESATAAGESETKAQLYAERAEAAMLKSYKRYVARWDKANAQLTRFGDCADITTDTRNFAYLGSVNANYNNPFDAIYPWSGRRLCNIDMDKYRGLTAGKSLKECVSAWEGEPGFSYDNQYGVWVYTPEFWADAWEDGTYRWYEVADREAPGLWHYPESIGGRWHGCVVSLTIDGASKSCLLPVLGMPGKRIAMSTLHSYAKNWGASIDNIYQYNASTMLYLVEFGSWQSQAKIGNGVSSLYRESNDHFLADSTDSAVVTIAASLAGNIVPGAIFDIGTSNGAIQVGSFYVVSSEVDSTNTGNLLVTLDRAVTVTTANFWSVHGLINTADADIGSKSGYIGTNSKSIAYYRGEEFFGNMFRYILGAYHQKTTNKLFICEDEKLCDNYDGLNTGVHKDTEIVLSASGGYVKKLGFGRTAGLCCIPACTEVGGNSDNPVGDYHWINENYDTVLIAGGNASNGGIAGRCCGNWSSPSSYSAWYYAARPLLKSP